jgi:hypothetical protein
VQQNFVRINTIKEMLIITVDVDMNKKNISLAFVYWFKFGWIVFLHCYFYFSRSQMIDLKDLNLFALNLFPQTLWMENWVERKILVIWKLWELKEEGNKCFSVSPDITEGRWGLIDVMKAKKQTSKQEMFLYHPMTSMYIIDHIKLCLHLWK